MPARSPRNFRGYAAMEALNILLLPGMALLLATPRHLTEAVAMGLAIAACAAFLAVGTLYWGALDRRLRARDRTSLARMLSWAHRLELPLLAVTAAAFVALVPALWLHGLSWPNAAALALAVLAVLEYINYYRRQLQHFDRWSDFRRLVTSWRLPRSHMARDLAAFRQTRQRG